MCPISLYVLGVEGQGYSCRGAHRGGISAGVPGRRTSLRFTRLGGERKMPGLKAFGAWVRWRSHKFCELIKDGQFLSNARPWV
jgi:hypothetical protein